MTNVTTTELFAIDGGECYSAGISFFGLEIGIHFGNCPLNK